MVSFHAVDAAKSERNICSTGFRSALRLSKCVQYNAFPGPAAMEASQSRELQLDDLPVNLHGFKPA